MEPVSDIQILPLYLKLTCTKDQMLKSVFLYFKTCSHLPYATLLSGESNSTQDDQKRAMKFL